MGFWVAGILVMLVLFRVSRDGRAEYRDFDLGERSVTGDLSRLLNALGLVAVDTVLVLALSDQLWFRDLPCPICILQRAGFIAAGFGIALNLIFGPQPEPLRPRHPRRRGRRRHVMRQTRCCTISFRGPAPTATRSSGCISTPGRSSIFALIVVGSAVMLLFDRQFEPTGPLSARLRPLPLVGRSSARDACRDQCRSRRSRICGMGLCPERPAAISASMITSIGAAPSQSLGKSS